MQDFDKNLINKLNQSIDGTFPSEYVKNKIDLKIENYEKNTGGYIMKKTKKFKLVTALALCIAFVGVGTYAAGNFTGTIGASPETYSYSKYDQVDQALEEVAFEAAIPDKISSYTFKGITVGQIADMDDQGNEFNKRKNLIVDYKNDQGQTLSLFIDKKGPGSPSIAEEEHQEAINIEGRTFYFTRLESLSVSGEEDLSPEEIQRSEKDPFFNVAYGGPSQERESSVSTHLSVENEGITYSLMGDENITSQDFFQMGQEIFQ